MVFSWISFDLCSSLPSFNNCKLCTYQRRCDPKMNLPVVWKCWTWPILLQLPMCSLQSHLIPLIPHQRYWTSSNSCLSFSCCIMFCCISINVCTKIREGNGTPLQYSCLENPMDRGAWWAAVHGLAKSQTRLNDFTFTFMHWRRKWQPTPGFLPWESQGRGAWWAAVYGVTQSRKRQSDLAAAAACTKILFSHACFWCL